MSTILRGSDNLDSSNVASDTELATGLALKANTSDLKEIGVGQTWQNVTASRSYGVTYTNSTGKPIVVSLSLNGSSGTYGYIQINGINAFYFGDTAGSVSDNSTATLVVPEGNTYRVNFSYADGTWLELR